MLECGCYSKQLLQIADNSICSGSKSSCWFSYLNNYILVIERKDRESVDRMLKHYKRKHRDVKLRNRKYFTKKSVTRRTEIKDAIYRDKKLTEEDG